MTAHGENHMHTTLEERLRFLQNHWQGSMGWKAVPLWCVVASEGLFAARPAWYQLLMYAGGVLLSWLWTRSMQPFVDERIGVMRRTVTVTSKGTWWRVLLALVPLLGVQGLVGARLEHTPRNLPLGLSEHHLMGACSAYLATMLALIVDSSNLRIRRLWYAAAAFVWSVLTGAMGYAGLTYARGFLCFGLLQCVVALADLSLLLHLAGAPAEAPESRWSRG